VHFHTGVYGFFPLAADPRLGFPHLARALYPFN